MKVSKTVMKAVGATLAVCSAMTMIESCNMSAHKTKKAVKKTANKVAGIVDTITAFM